MCSLAQKCIVCIPSVIGSLLQETRKSPTGRLAHRRSCGGGEVGILPACILYLCCMNQFVSALLLIATLQLRKMRNSYVIRECWRCFILIFRFFKWLQHGCRCSVSQF